MEKGRKFLSIIIIFILVSYCLFSLFSNPTYAANQVISTDINAIDENAYPGFKERINALKAQFPNWNFKIFYTDLDWNEVISEEYVGHGNSPRNQVQAISNYQGAWICPCGFAAGSWRCASEDAIKYMMDPRNSLNASDIFQFEELTNNGYDMNQIINMTNGTFLQGHYEEITRAGNNTGISPYFIIARMLQEQGKGGTALTSGVYGYYNPFNIQANGADPISNGVAYAQSQGWDTLEKGITGGIEFLSREYTKRGQNTLYLQKFDVDATSDGLYWHQYMQNILAAQNEGSELRRTLEKFNLIESDYTFVIPVYKNMPSSASPRPSTTSTGGTENKLVRINVTNSLYIRETPGKNAKKIGSVFKDEIVTRLEKATSKIDGTYWDYIMKSDGTKGYAARETYDYESSYKLYLVPLSEESNPEPTPAPEPEQPQEPDVPDEIIRNDKIEVNKTINSAVITPNTTVQQIIDFLGADTTVKNANGDVLKPGDVVSTNCKINDTYSISVLGDVNGDGLIDTGDTYQLKLIVLGREQVQGETHRIASDVNRDGYIDTGDTFILKKQVLNISNITL